MKDEFFLQYHDTMILQKDADRNTQRRTVMKKMYMNTDINTGTFPFLNKLNEQEKITPDMLYPYIDVHRHTQITDFVMNICAKGSSTPSDVFMDYADIYESMIIGTDRSDSEEGKSAAFRGLYDIQKKHGIDVYATWIDRCRQVGFNPWFSFRMNDCHASTKTKSDSPKDFYVRASENGWILGEKYGYYSGCFDYSYEEVRNYYLSYIREQTQRYDVYGIELDFLREYHCFPYLTADMSECRAIMTQFMREVKAIVLDAERIHGHEMKIMIRLPRDIEHCLYYGFDPAVIAGEGLVDIVVTSPRFAGSDSGIDLDEWRRALPGVTVIPGIEAAVGIVDGKFVDTSKEIALGLAANYLSYDPAGLYFFNHFISPRIFSSFFSPLCEYEQKRLATHEPWEKSFAVLACAADYKTIYQSAIRFVIIPEGYEACAGYPEMWRPIPTEIGTEKKSFALRTGLIPKGKKCSVILGFDGGAECFDVTLNGVSVTGFEKNNIGFIEGIGYQPGNAVSEKTVCYRAKFDESILTEPVQNITVKANRGTPTLNWVEINVY